MQEAPPAPGPQAGAPAPDESRRGRRLLRRVPAVAWSISALHVALLLAYSVLAPTYRAPDEPLHVDLAHLFSEQLDYPAWDERDTGSGILRSLSIVDFHDGSRHLEASAAPDRGDRPSIDELEDPPRARGINQLPQHPPLYYVVAGGLARAAEVVTGDPLGSFDLETWFYRLVSIAVVAPLPLVVWATARRLGLPSAVAVTAMLFPLAVPEYLHIASAVNNDSLLILLFCLLTPLVLRIADGDVTVRTGALAGLVTGLALYTKGFALVMPLWVLAGLVVALRRMGRGALRRTVVAGGAYGIVMLAAGGWWWIANLVRYGEPLPSRYGEMVSPVETDARDVGEFIGSWATLTTRRFWGDFGWHDVHIPGVAVAAATAVVITGIVLACVRRDRVSGTRLGDRLLLAAPFVLLVVLQFLNGLRGYLELGRMPGLQGRYWFGGLAALGVVVAVGFANLAGRAVRFLPLAALAGATAMNAVGMWAMLGLYWGAPDSAVSDRLRAVVAWAPVEGEILALGALLGGLALALTVGHLVAMALGPGDDRDGEVPPEAGAARPAPVEVGAR